MAEQPGHNKGPALLVTKVSPPRLAAATLTRVHLDHGISEDTGVRLATIRAPAGYGKTTLMLQWWRKLRDSDVSCAWLTLDTGDNDFQVFAAYFAAALRTADPTLAVEAALGRDLGGSRAAVVTHLLDRLGRLERPVALFIDDAETVGNAEVLDLLRRVVGLGNPNLLLVVSSRSVLRLGQARLRVRGGLLEIDGDALRFRQEETAALLSERVGGRLDERDVRELHLRTDGWPAALQLACLSLHGREDAAAFVRSFSGQHDDLAEYLAEDVVSRQPPLVRDFLLATSLLDRLTGSLCEAVTGQADGEGMLAQLEEAGMFLRHIDAQGPTRWYRYHALFADFLQGQLRRRAPAQVAAIHLAASEWFAAHGLVQEAAEHARKGGDVERAADLVEAMAMAWIRQGQLNTVIGWAERLPPESLDRHPHLHLGYVWSLAFLRRYDDALETLERLIAAAGGIERLPPDLHDGVIALLGMIPALSDDLVTARQRIGDSIARLSAAGTFEHGVLVNVAAHCHIAAGEFDQARAILATAGASYSHGGNLFGHVYSRMLEGLSHLCELHLQQAISSFRTALDDTQRSLGGHSHSSAVLVGFLAESLYEANEIRAAEAVLHGHLPLIAEAGIPDVLLAAFLTMARIRFLEGDDGGALALLEELEALGHLRRLPRVVTTARWETARLAVLRGRQAEAERLIAQIDDAPVRVRHGDLLTPGEALTRDLAPLRLALWLNRPAGAAAAELQRHAEDARRRGFRRRLLHLRLLRAVALAKEGERTAAVGEMVEALRLGVGEGFQRAYLDEGPIAVQLVRAARPVLLASLPARHLAHVRERLDTLLERAADDRAAGYTFPGNLGTPAAARADPAEVPLDRLTEREIQILEQLAQGLSNRDLAGRLALSETTVKWHLRNIFGKLGAGNRTEAVFSARQLNLIA